MSLVIDSSATLAWIYADETTAAIRHVFDRVADEGAVVPSLWRLTAAVRRQRIDADFRQAALADLALCDITVDEQTDELAWSEMRPIPSSRRGGVWFATRHASDLRMAARADGLELLGEGGA